MLTKNSPKKCVTPIVLFLFAFSMIWVVLTRFEKPKIIIFPNEPKGLHKNRNNNIATNSPKDLQKNLEEDLKIKLEKQIQDKFKKQLQAEHQVIEKLRMELEKQVQEKNQLSQKQDVQLEEREKLQKELEDQQRENRELQEQLKQKVKEKPVDKSQADYDAVYNYHPLKAELVQGAVAKLQNGTEPEVEPVSIEYNFTIVTHPAERCKRPLGILIVIKTCPQNTGRRELLRQTWANSTYLNQFDVPIEYTFVLGRSSSDDDSLSQTFLHEVETRRDFILADFVDSYRNNTHKVIAGFRWAIEHCKDFEHLIIADDDMYVSIHNVLRFLRGERNYPKISTNNSTGEFGFLLDGNSNFWSGCQQGYSPVVHVRSDLPKWYVSYDEYPFPLYPPVLLGMLNFYSRNVAQKILLASPYVKPLSIDDAYLTIIGFKLDLKPVAINEYLFFYGDEDRNSTRAVNAIGIHGVGPYIEFWQTHDV